MECICDWIVNNANALIAALNLQATQNQVCDQTGCFESGNFKYFVVMIYINDISRFILKY
jgi:hypothetical protein